MKFVKIIALILSVMCFAESSTCAMFSGRGDEESEEDCCVKFSIETFMRQRDKVCEEIERHADLLSASKGKDIVVVFGNTGSGKSTTLDWLAGKSLKVVGRYGRIELENPEDPSALPIGCRSASIRYPKSITINGTEFFDVPEFHNFRGTIDELINVVFLKQILEKARSVKIMFVVSKDELRTDYAESLGDILSSVKAMLGDKYENIMSNSSLFVMTKSDCSSEELSEFLEERITEKDGSILHNWLSSGRMFQVEKPQDKTVVEEGKFDILNALRCCRGTKLSRLNLSQFYSHEIEEALSKIFEEISHRKVYKRVPDSGKVNPPSGCDYAEVHVSNETDFRRAMKENSDGATIVLEDDIHLYEPLDISASFTIRKNGHKILKHYKDDHCSRFSEKSEDYQGTIPKFAVYDAYGNFLYEESALDGEGATNVPIIELEDFQDTAPKFAVYDAYGNFLYYE